MVTPRRVIWYELPRMMSLEAILHNVWTEPAVGFDVAVGDEVVFESLDGSAIHLTKPMIIQDILSIQANTTSSKKRHVANGVRVLLHDPLPTIKVCSEVSYPIYK